MPEYREVDPQELRRIFNNSGYRQKVETGEIIEEELSDCRPRRGSNQDRGTRSKRMAWKHSQTGQQVAVVHYYLKRTWLLGGSGKPDPKWVRVGRIIYRLRTPN
ncbi:MAG TPA: hypothetical protein VFJ78_05565, partial [Gaiellaceae bacterium]|nr:hypothetical protein [Gaiellaceae bacterium]